MEEGPKPFDVKESDPRIIEGKIHKDPINISYYIDKIVFNILNCSDRNRKEFDDLLTRILEQNAFVRDSYYIREKNPDCTVNPQAILDLTKSLRALKDNDEVWKVMPKSFFGEEGLDFREGYLNSLAEKNKEEVKKMIDKYVKALEYFSLESFNPKKREKH